MTSNTTNSRTFTLTLSKVTNERSWNDNEDAWEFPLRTIPGLVIRDIWLKESNGSKRFFKTPDDYFFKDEKPNFIYWRQSPPETIFLEIALTKVLSVREWKWATIGVTILGALITAFGPMGSEAFKKANGHKDYQNVADVLSPPLPPKSSTKEEKDGESEAAPEGVLVYVKDCGGSLEKKPYYRIYTTDALDDAKRYCDARKSPKNADIVIVATFDDQEKATQYKERLSRHLKNVWVGPPENE
jgi:hypothetical protein